VTQDQTPLQLQRTVVLVGMMGSGKTAIGRALSGARTDDPYATLAALLAQRTPVYAKAALHLSVKPDASIEETTADAIALLRDAADQKR